MTAASKVTDLIGQVLSELVQNINFENNREKERVLQEWIKEGKLQNATASYVISLYRRDVLQQEYKNINDNIKNYLSRHSGNQSFAFERKPDDNTEKGGGTGLHQFVRIRHWGDLSVDPTLDLIKHRVMIEPNQYSKAPKCLGKPLGWPKAQTVLGENTTDGEKTLSYNHFVSLMKQGKGRMLVLSRSPDQTDTSNDAPCGDNPVIWVIWMIDTRVLRWDAICNGAIVATRRNHSELCIPTVEKIGCVGRSRGSATQCSSRGR